MSRLPAVGQQIQHIERLEIANRAKKAKDWINYKQNEAVITKERNFHLYLNGANQQRVREHKRLEVESNRFASVQPHGYASIHRRKWGSPETPQIFKQSPEASTYKRSYYQERKNPLQSAGNAMVNFTARFERLNSGQKRTVLEFMDKCETGDLLA